MDTILCIETATNVCSVALFRKDKITAYIESEIENAHSKTLTVFIKKILEEEGIAPGNIDAVAVSSGPGSYTGLRIGVSVAKGFCYGLSTPLLMIPTTEILAQGCLSEVPVKESDLIVSMIDARRMEVYHATYSTSLELLAPIEPHIIDENSYKELLAKNFVHFCGNGAFKLLQFPKNDNVLINTEIKLSARYMLLPAQKRIHSGCFANLAYDEPLYLKEFEAKLSKPFFK
jgi:tRNA threonylcarbamoyladenosine biosynthesis protein TsaB